jgi:hypothetical protein
VCERIRRDPRKNVRKLRKLIDVCSHFVLVYHPKNILSLRRKPRQQERTQVQDTKETLPNGGLPARDKIVAVKDLRGMPKQ